MPEKIRVVYLADKLDQSGTPLQIVELALHLDHKKFQPHFIVLSFVDEKIRAQLEKNEIGFEALGRDNWVKAEAWRDLRRLYRLFRQYRPDVVHAYLATSNVLAALVGALARVPIIISSHRDLGGFDGKWISRLNHWTDRRLIDGVTVNCGAVREALAKRSGLAAEAITVLYNGVDLEKINRANRRDAKRAELGLQPEDLAIALIANFHPAKGHRYLIEAFNRLARRFPNARLLLCGYCNEAALLNSLQQLVAAAGTEKQIWFMGSRQDVPEIVHAIDVLAAPSLSEGFSNSILEALAAGKPVVASRAGGNLEQIIDGLNGYLVPPAESIALANALEKLLSSPDKLQHMGEAAKTRVQQHFSVEKMAEAHQQLYSRLLQRKDRQSTS